MCSTNSSGHSRFLSKLARKVRTLVLLVLAVPAVLVVAVLRPVVLVRFGHLKVARLGHLSLNTELYQCELDAGVHGKRWLNFFYASSGISNQQLLRMWGRTLHIHPFARYIDRINRRLPGGAVHRIVLPTDRDERQLLRRTRPHISFTAEEFDSGRKALAALGVPEGEPFICFHSRDSAYLNTLVTGHDWSYHDYRDTEVGNFLPAAEEMGRRGYYALRMGAVVKETVVSDSPRVIDYASKGRSDFMDIYLLANCRFFLCSSSGLMGVANTFRVPLAYAGEVPLEYEPRGKRDLFIPKKLWLRNEKRFLTFREIVESGAGRYLRGDEFEALGLELVENSKDDVMALAVEMDERLEGKWDTSDEDADLQQRYWALFDETTLCHNSPSRIGAAFLRQNRNLLD